MRLKPRLESQRLTREFVAVTMSARVGIVSRIFRSERVRAAALVQDSSQNNLRVAGDL